MFSYSWSALLILPPVLVWLEVLEFVHPVEPPNHVLALYKRLDRLGCFFLGLDWDGRIREEVGLTRVGLEFSPSSTPSLTQKRSLIY